MLDAGIKVQRSETQHYHDRRNPSAQPKGTEGIFFALAIFVPAAAYMRTSLNVRVHWYFCRITLHTNFSISGSNEMATRHEDYQE